MTIRSVLIANRGEIARRIIRTLRAEGIGSVAVYTDPDRDEPHAREADRAVALGAANQYLNVTAIVDAARRTGVDAVHPGYGFLAENAALARELVAAGISFIGPPAAAIEVMGDKIAARAAVSRAGVPVVPGESRPGLTDSDLLAAAPHIGFPVLIKPSAGGGGKGMHRANDLDELAAALVTARREATSAFGDDTLFLERFVSTPRHIEVQILADAHGNIIHLGERECSLQRRHQKVIEEAPSVLLRPQTRERIGAAACAVARSVGYIGAGTVEFIVSATAPTDFFFMEMNTRLQVEHPVTEMVTGIDLVAAQLRVADGAPLGISQEMVSLHGHAIEARIYAEDPAHGFLPTGGVVHEVTWPAVRVDAGVAVGSAVGVHYDPMMAKVIVHGATRAEALDSLVSALAGTHLVGVRSNIDFLRAVLRDPAVRAGDLDTGLLDRFSYTDPVPSVTATLAAAVATLPTRGNGDDPWDTETGWRIGGLRESVRVTLTHAEETLLVTLPPGHGIATVDRDGDSADYAVSYHRDSAESARVSIDVDGVRTVLRAYPVGSEIWVRDEAGTIVFGAANADDDTRTAADTADEVRSPMPGTVVAATASGPVRHGDVVVVLEAMKMEHTLTAPHDGVLETRVSAGQLVSAGDVVASVVRAAAPPASDVPPPPNPVPPNPAPPEGQ